MDSVTRRGEEILETAAGAEPGEERELGSEPADGSVPNVCPWQQGGGNYPAGFAFLCTGRVSPARPKAARVLLNGLVWRLCWRVLRAVFYDFLDTLNEFRIGKI